MAAGALFALLIFGVAHTDWGRAQLARLAESAASAALPGHLQIGALKGSLLTELAVERVALYPPEGPAVAELQRLRLALLPPWEGLGVRRLVLERPRLDLPRLASALPPPGPPAPPEPPGPPFELPDLQAQVQELAIRDGQVQLTATERVEQLRLTVTATLADRALVVQLRELSGRVAPRALPFQLSASTTLVGEQLRQLRADLQAGQLRLQIPQARLSAKAQQARLRLKAPPGALAAALMQPDLTVSAGLEGTLEHPSADAPLSATLKGAVAGRPFSLELNADPKLTRASVQLRWDGVDPRKIHRAAPPGRLRLSLKTTGKQLLDPQTRHLDTHLGLDGRLHLPRLPELRLNTQLTAALRRGQDLRAQLKLDTNIGQLAGQAALALRDQPHLQQAKLDLQGLRLGPLSQPGLPLGGQADLHAQAHGPLDALTASLSAQLSKLRVAGLRLGRGELQADARGLPARPSGAAKLHATGVSGYGLQLRQLDVNAHARAGQALTAAVDARGRGLLRLLRLKVRAALGSPLALWIDELQLQSRGPLLSLHAGAKRAKPPTPDHGGATSPTAQAHHTGQTAGGATSPTAQAHHTGQTAGGGRLTMAPGAGGSIPAQPGPTAQGSLDRASGGAKAADRAQNTHRGAAAQAHATDQTAGGGRLPMAPGAGGSIPLYPAPTTAPSLSLVGQRLELAPLTLTSTAGQVMLQASLRLDAPLGPDSAAQLQVQGLNLPPWRALIGLPLSGQLDLQAALPKGARGPQLRVQGRQLATTGLPPWDLQLSLSQARRRAQLGLQLRSAEAGALDLKAKLRTPRRLDNARAWERLGLRALRSAALDIQRLRLDKLPVVKRAAQLRSGQVHGSLKAGDALRHLQADLQVSELSTGLFPHRVDTQLRADINAQASALAVDLDLDQVPRLHLKASTSVGGPRLATGGLGALLKADSQLQLELPEMPLAALNQRLPGADQPIQGLLALSLTASRRAGRTDAKLKSSLQALQIAPQTPQLAAQLSAEVAPGDTRVALGLRGEDLGAVQLDAGLNTPADPLDSRAWSKLGPQLVRQANLQIRALQLGGLVPFAVVPPTLQGRVDGQLAVGPALQTATASVALTRLRVHPLIAPLHADLQLRAQPTQLDTGLQLRFGLRPLAELTAQLDRGLPGLIAGELDKAQLRARLALVGGYLEQVFASPLAAENLHARLLGEVVVQGPLRSPKVQAELRLEEAMFAGLIFDDFSVAATTDLKDTEASLRLKQQDGGRLEAGLHLAEGGPLQLKTEARAFDLEFLSALASAVGGPAIALEGMLAGDMRAQLGEQLDLNGTLKIDRLRVVVPADVPPIERGQLSLRADHRDLSLKLDAQAGRGKLGLDAGFQLSNLKLQAKLSADKVHMVAGGTVVQLNLDTEVQGAPRDGAYAVEVVLDNTLIRLPDESGESLAAIGGFDDLRYVDQRWQPSATMQALFTPKQPEAPKPEGGGLHLKIRSRNPLQLSGDPIQALASIDLDGETKPQGFSLSGRVWVDQGEVSLFSRRYTIDRGEVLFDGQIPPSVNLNLKLSHQFNTMSFFIGVRGPATEPKLTLSGKPAIYDQKQLTAIMLGADPDSESAGRSAAEVGASVAANMVIAQLQRKLAKDLPFDTIKVDVADPDDPEAASSLTLGRWINRDLFLAYRIIPGAGPSKNSNEGVLRYRLFRRWMLEGVFGNAYNGSADVLWVKRW